MGLTIKQKAFAEYYIKLGNATESYIKAGYKASKREVAEANARKLLGKDSVKKYIKEKMEEISNNRIADATEILEYLTKGIRQELEDLEKKILSVTNKQEKRYGSINLVEKNLQLSVTKILHDLGIPSNIKGYSYIRDAITLVYNNPELIGGITKELYPEIGKKYNISITRVERSIRHAIEVSWNRGDWDLMEEIFGHSVDIDKAKPTNSEFIVTIADKLKLDTLKINS